MNWELIKVKQTDWIQDNSGYYTLINYIGEDIVIGVDIVRLDIMDKDDIPIISFQGIASDIRKHIMQSIDQCNVWHLSFEHASYIGSELARCELLKTEYKQD